MHGGRSTVKHTAEPKDAIMGAGAAARANGDGGGVLAFALQFGERRYQVFAHSNVAVVKGVIDHLKKTKCRRRGEL